MKTSCLLIIATLLFTAACAKEKSNKKNKPAPAKPVEENEKEKEKETGTIYKDLRYSGVVIYEFGTSKTAKFTTKEKDRSPKSRIHICIDKSGQKMSGQIKINFEEMEIGTYENFIKDLTPKENSLKALSLVLNYEWTGGFESSEKDSDSNGKVLFSGRGSDIEIVRAYPSETQITQEQIEDLSWAVNATIEYDADSTTPFNVKNTVFESGGTYYYILRHFEKVTKTEKGISPIEICEKENKPVIYEKIEQAK